MYSETEQKMKGFIVTLIIFILIIVGLFFYASYMDSAFSDLLTLLDETENSINTKDFSGAYRYADKFSKALIKKSYTLYFFADRCPIDNALVESSRLKSFIKSEDDAEASSVLSGLKTMLNKISEKASLRLYNIL